MRPIWGLAFLLALSLLGCAEKPVVDEDFKTFNAQRWEPMTHTYPCNETRFTPDNVKIENGRLGLWLTNVPREDRLYSGAELRLKPPASSADGYTLSHGRYEARMKGGKINGAVTGFFLYRMNPWQEIDMELIDGRPNTVITNVFYNPGPAGAPNNEMVYDSWFIDVDFDTTAEFHNYAFEWDEKEIRWYIDGKLVRTRKAPDYIPDLPMSLRLNHWINCEAASDWAGKFDPRSLPGESQFSRVRIWEKRGRP
jgi:beta-glucanase (GH16 family)